MILSQFLDATLKTLDSDRTREILRKVRQIEIRTRRLVTDALAGAYHSSFKGQGMDFDEVREYAAGDDIRSIDSSKFKVKTLEFITEAVVVDTNLFENSGV